MEGLKIGDLQLEGQEVVVAMADPGNLPSNPSWPLRNLLLLATFRWRATRLTVVCWRSRGGLFCPERSLWLDVGLPELPEGGSYCAYPAHWLR